MESASMGKNTSQQTGPSVDPFPREIWPRNWVWRCLRGSPILRHSHIKILHINLNIFPKGQETPQALFLRLSNLIRQKKKKKPRLVIRIKLSSIAIYCNEQNFPWVSLWKTSKTTGFYSQCELCTWQVFFHHFKWRAAGQSLHLSQPSHDGNLGWLKKKWWMNSLGSANNLNLVCKHPKDVWGDFNDSWFWERYTQTTTHRLLSWRTPKVSDWWRFHHIMNSKNNMETFIIKKKSDW